MKQSVWILLHVIMAIMPIAGSCDEKTPVQRGPAQSEKTLASHWAFNPIVRPDLALDIIANKEWIQSPVDYFILRKLELSGASPSPEADKRTLIRRLYLDLVGFPPPSQAVNNFVHDHRIDAFSQLVDRLLADPAFGQRWGRHWLDLAGYADSNGYEDDRIRPDAWRYRDWVVTVFNEDLPFDKFTIRQLAGDLLPRQQASSLVATGWHRMPPSNEGGTDAIIEEFRTIAVKDRVNTLGTTWLGLTVGCAQCHSHKYDPLTHEEYYQFYAFFNNTDHASIKAPPPGPRYQREYEVATKAYRAQVAAAVNRLAQFEKEELPARQAQWESKAVLNTTLPDNVRAALKVVPKERTSQDKILLHEFYRRSDPLYVSIAEEARIQRESGNNRPTSPSKAAMVIAQSSTPRDNFIHLRGSFEARGEKVVPATPAFLTPIEPRSAEADRLDLARWIVRDDNPLTARVAVNLMWQRLFGHGLVATGDNFGRNGARPSHPELVDWLASEYLRLGWSRKAMLRTIVLSSTYRQSSLRRPDLQALDPDNQLFGRQNRLRLEAEIVRDAALAVSKNLDTRLGGPSFQPVLPTGLNDLVELKNERLLDPSPESERRRRGIYINVQRMFPLPFLSTFDAPDSSGTCTRRDASTTPIQALSLLNDPVFVEAAVLLGITLADSASTVPSAFEMVLGRLPTQQESNVLQRLFDQLLHQQSQSTPPDSDTAEQLAWIGIARTLLNLDEFIHRD